MNIGYSAQPVTSYFIGYYELHSQDVLADNLIF